MRDEWFAPVLGVTELPGDDPASFWIAAVEAANERLHGTLGANVIAHPRSMRALAASSTTASPTSATAPSRSTRGPASAT